MDIRNIKIRPYYYVGQCTKCGSEVTGRYVRTHRTTENEWMIDEALKNGELVRPITEILGDNCFCLECGEDFNAPVEFRLISTNELKEEKIKRHTVEFLSERLGDDYHQKARGPLGFMINFIGKI